MAQINFASEEERERDDDNFIERRDTYHSYEKGAAKSEDDETMPLFPKIRQDQRKTVHQINVIRRDPPNDGFKGTVPSTATMEYIAQKYGNGLYDFEAVLEDGKVLRRNQGVKIACDVQPQTSKAAQAPAPAFDLLQWQSEQSERDQKRANDISQRSMDMVRSHAEHSTTALREQMTATQLRDREFFQSLFRQQSEMHAAQTMNMQTFFSAMLAQTNADHARFMERSREEHRQTMEVIYANNKREEQNPQLYFDLIRQGMLLAAGPQVAEDDESEENDENSPWTESIREGISAVKDITQVFAAKAGASAIPAATPATPASAPNSLSSGQPAIRRRRAPIPGIQKEDIRKIARLKILLDQQGIDFSSSLDQLSQMVAMGGMRPNAASEPAESEEETQSESGPAESDDSES